MYKSVRLMEGRGEESSRQKAKNVCTWQPYEEAAVLDALGLQRCPHRHDGTTNTATEMCQKTPETFAFYDKIPLFWLYIHFVPTTLKHLGKYEQFPAMARLRNFWHYNELKAIGTQMKLYFSFELLTFIQESLNNSCDAASLAILILTMSIFLAASHLHVSLALY